MATRRPIPPASSNRSRRRGPARSVEILEGRQLMAVFTVSNLNPAGLGSLAMAIVDANKAAGADTIDFAVSGTVRVNKAPIPVITGSLTIDGTSAPTFAGSPVVKVDFHGTHGFVFAKGADGSVLSALSIIGASNSGVTIDASKVTVEGNVIASNKGDGVRIDASSHGDLIGHSDPVTGVSFTSAPAVGSQSVSAWQGIRDASTPGQYLITGTLGKSTGLLYEGPISGVGGVNLTVSYPGATSTSVYGPDITASGGLRLVGSYKDGDGMVHGFLFEGSEASLSTAANYRTIDYPGAKYTYVHSSSGDLAVGNGDGPEGNSPLGTGHAFLDNVAGATMLADIVYPGSTTTTAYGIWSNGKGSYTIAGGYSLAGSGSHGYLVDYNAITGQYSNWTSFDYPNGVVGKDYITHFEGISSDEKGVYTLVADSAQVGATNVVQGSFVTVRRNTDGSFGPSTWVDLNDPNVPGIVSANSVAGNQVVGIVVNGSGATAYQATINTGFQLSNVISGNAGNGVGIYGASGNVVAMNDIGTDSTGTIRRGNAKNGILITAGATGNLIGGQATGGNDPTASVFDRPPEGNLISANRGDGILINQGSTANLVSGNYVGTTASGNSSLGNNLDGVTIDHADGNQLIGCTFPQDPFVFYNVISGNARNGLRINSSNNTTVQANFLGVGANNASIVANGGDGLLVSGSSRNTQVGGVIPLGNVISGNDKNGIEVKDTVSGFISFNTFAGLYAFGASAPNLKDGILVTSTGGDNLIRTCIVSGNLGNGIELAGNATGVQITQTAVGTNTSIMTALPNQGSGIVLTDHAHGNAIGGFQPSIEPQVTVSANRGYGLKFVGRASKNVVFDTAIGTNFNGSSPLPNGLGTILVGPAAKGNKINDSSVS